MIVNSIINVIIISALLIASYTDIKRREVPDWLSYGLIFVGLGLRLIYSLAVWEFSYIIYGLAGFGIMLAFALVMFYAGQWGGGDSKVLMGLGALIGLEFSAGSFLVSFFLNSLIVGAFYGLVWSILAAFANFNKFKKEVIIINKRFANLKKALIGAVALLILILIFSPDIVLKIMAGSAALVFSFTFYLMIFVKAVENACMLKYVKPSELTEGDWIANDILVGGKKIAGPRDLGVSKKQIKQLAEFYKKKKVRKVLIKTGIPFVPAFLAAYIITLFIGNIALVFL